MPTPDDSKSELTRTEGLVDAAIKTLGIDPATARIQAPGAGTAWTLMRGSAAMAIFLRPPREHEESAYLRVVAPVMHIDPARENDLFRHLLKLNASGLASVAFGLSDDRVVAVSERPVTDLDAGEVGFILRMVGAVADHYDDELVQQFGGRRASDR